MKLTTPAVLWMAVALPLAAAAPKDLPGAFLYGASTYPELQTTEQRNRMLDVFQKAGFNVVRVSESSWGNLETGPGQFDFGWLKDYLDELHKRGMRAILGTSSYIPPQWLSEEHPEILAQPEPGIRIHPMSRKAASLTQPLYREACRRYIRALAQAFSAHPAVIGWQLDNEIEFLVDRPDYNPAAEQSWHQWLHQTYGSAQEFNRRLDLVSWGMRVRSLDAVPLPGETEEGRRMLPALNLAYLHYRRDVILGFLAEQARTLRDAGVRQWITTDWNTVWLALADDPLARQAVDIAGLNFYQPSGENAGFWRDLAWQLDMHRSAYGLGRFVVTETRFGVAGSTFMSDPYPTHDQFRMWMLQPIAFGARGILFWSGNRWRGGHWPHWGGLLDWSGAPERDLPWAAEIAQFVWRWDERLGTAPVEARVAVLTDFDNRSALEIYAHTPSSRQVLAETFDLLHRAGIGADAMNLSDAAHPDRLARYAAVVIPAASALDGDAVPRSLRTYAEQGGKVLITPFTAYQDGDGIFRGDGFGANLAALTGVVVPTARRMGTAKDSGRQDQRVRWSSPAGLTSTAGIDGYCELLNVSDAEVVARFESAEPILNGRPAATRRKVGKGSVMKLAFWPEDDSLFPLLQQWAGGAALLSRPAPPGVEVVPRSDGSVFVINTSRAVLPLELRRGAKDRISNRLIPAKYQLAAFEVLWLE